MEWEMEFDEKGGKRLMWSWANGRTSSNSLSSQQTSTSVYQTVTATTAPAARNTTTKFISLTIIIVIIITATWTLNMKTICILSSMFAKDKKNIIYDTVWRRLNVKKWREQKSKKRKRIKRGNFCLRGDCSEGKCEVSQKNRLHGEWRQYTNSNNIKLYA